MRPSFHCQLINGPFADPGLLVHLAFQKKSLLFDLGDLSAVPPADLLKVDHIFVSHTHMDHFIGFDQLLRLLLGRPKKLHLYGPEGFLQNVAGKLAGYTWNLVRNYEEALEMEVSEIQAEQQLTQMFDCRAGFKPSGPPRVNTRNDYLHQDSALNVGVDILDHQIPCLAFNLHENFHINVLRNQLDALGLGVGPWLRNLKKLLQDGADPDTEVIVPAASPDGTVQKFRLGYLSSKILRMSRGQKIAYVTDAVYNAANVEKIVRLAQGADHLFIEAAFLDKDQDIARAKCHLTSRQAGRIAREAGVRKFSIFHYSPRYTNAGHLLELEAREAFEGLT